MSNLDLLKTYSAFATHALARHEVAAKNIANSDTPGFEAKKVETFSAYFKTLDNDLTKARSPVIMSAKNGASPNGNSVSLEQALMESSAAKGQFELALGVYQKTMDILKLSLGRR